AARLAYATARSHAFSISREDGISLALGGRRRWDLEPSATHDRSYSEVSAWGAAYHAIRLFGFADHVIALRASSIWRNGAGASPADIGGAPGAALPLPAGGSIGSGSVFLPVRSFLEGDRAGTRAWTASLEYRLPIALVGRGVRLWPLFLDRLSASLFLDAGDAWCPAAATRTETDCARPALRPLVGTGAELALDLNLFFGPTFRVRSGIGFPIQGPRDQPLAYLRLGPSF
ncbi:MAG: hypothetical protein HY703_00790, partial [Gemmatimonadetes bacterium]|nr:hypothetical protein [Gemmatimonadota bacterium]